MISYIDNDSSFDLGQIKQNEIYDKICSEADLYLLVRSLLNICEDMSISIQKNFIDESITFLSLDEVYRMWISKFKPFIDGHRKKYESNLIYIECEKLSNSWQNNKYLSTGEEI